MIVRADGSSRLLITQPDHAALAARIMHHWQRDGLPSSPRRAPILLAIDQHDNGWREVDASPLRDPASGELLDFITLPNESKWAIWPRGIERLSHTPYAAALVAQHALHVYGRHQADVAWASFFDKMQRARDKYLVQAPALSLEDLLHDYRFLRLGDLASLAFCSNWGEPPGEFGYTVRCDGTQVTVAPDPFNGQSFAIDVRARDVETGRPRVLKGVAVGGG